ncbi:acyltransferase family protein [Enterobacter hormaechei]|uniref:acyltransferase family protein n=1 Tax=Enterobacter hormaechei TaxID=158836 RepID=UPI003D6CDFC1
MKAIGIIVVVIGHYSSGFFNILQPYLYHMPLFFFVGGLTMRTESLKAKAFSKIFLKLAPYMVITYILTGLIALIINQTSGLYYGDPFYKDPVSTLMLALNKNMHNNQLFVVAWFLIAYFFCINYIKICYFNIYSFQISFFCGVSVFNCFRIGLG